MRSLGAPDDWLDLISSLVPDILELVRSTWQTMPPLAPAALEDPTTEEFCRRLRQSRTSAKLPCRIDIQMVELGESADADQGRMDIVFSPLLPTEVVYFCLECKRLNVTKSGSTRSYATEYVIHGMMRFITGQYASQVQHGGMLGYVLDGNVPGAIKRVSAVIGRRCEELGMERPCSVLRSSIRTADASARETRHRRGPNGDRFVIQHLFPPLTAPTSPTVSLSAPHSVTEGETATVTRS